MPEVSCHLPADPGLCFEVLEDPRSLRLLVAGTRKIRYFDPRWPEPGSMVHHTSGVFPFLVRDRTSVVGCEPGHRLLLDARMGSFGRFAVEFRLEDDAHGSEMVLEEHAVEGFAARRIPRPLLDAALRIRNRELCRRFRRLAARQKRRASGGADA